MFASSGRLILLAFSISSLLLVANASAQGAAADKSTQGVPQDPSKRKATLSFEDELVEGATQKPELFYLFQKKNFNYKRLIRLRENFLPEMRKTSEEIHRTRSGS